MLDTLVAAGVARSRADALAWCVRLVSQHTDEWLSELEEALSKLTGLLVDPVTKPDAMREVILAFQRQAGG